MSEPTRETVDSPTDPLLVLHVDHEGSASLVLRDDVDLSAAVSWLREAIAHVNELHGVRPPIAPLLCPHCKGDPPKDHTCPRCGASGTLAP